MAGIPDDCNTSNFLWYDVLTRAAVTATHHPLYGPGRLSHPARLFATPCNSGSDFVIPVQTRIFVQGLQGLQRPCWAKERQEDESSYTRTCSLSPSSIHCPIATNVAGMPFVSTRQRNQGPCPPPNLYAVVNYNRICAAVKGVTEDPLLFCPL